MNGLYWDEAGFGVIGRAMLSSFGVYSILDARLFCPYQNSTKANKYMVKIRVLFLC